MISSLAKAMPTRKPAKPPGFGKRLQNHQVGIFGQFLYKGFLPAEVDISLINHHNSVKIGQQVSTSVPVHGIAGRVIWRADKDQFGMLIDRFGNAFQIKLKFFG